MHAVACDKAFCFGCDGNLKERLVARVRQDVGKERRGHNVPTVLDVIQEGNYLILAEAELGTMKDFTVLR
jgi:hypothetical protein